MSSEVLSCSHCRLPVRKDGQQREFNGEHHLFCCYGCCLAFQVKHGRGEESEAAWLLIRLGVGTFLAMFIMLFSLLLYSGSFGPEDSDLVPLVHALLWLLTTPLLFILGGPFFRSAVQSAWQGRATADTLVSIGVLAAYAYSALQTLRGGDNVYFDTATMVLVLFTVGRYLEAASRARAARSLLPMLAAERARATVVSAGKDCERPVQDLRPGMTVRVRSGERVPVDGIVLQGHSQCDEAILTGQHEPQTKSPGVRVYAGSINTTGQLLIQTIRAGAATRWGQIGRFVSASLQRKSLAGKIVDQVAAVFVPAVVVLAAVTLFYWSQRESFEHALMIALAVLVVACPCALGLAAPLASALGLGHAAQNGILVRGGGVLERLAAVKAVAFDKTGTLSSADLQLVKLAAEDVSEQTLLARAAGLAQGSEHPIARSIATAAHEKAIEPTLLNDIQARPGQGVLGYYGEDLNALGSAAMMQALGWPISARLAAQAATTLRGCTLAYVGWGGAVRGLLGFADTPHSAVRPLIAGLTECGLASCLLSGDTAAAVSRVADAVGIETWQAELSPQAKVAALREWARHSGPVAMVGDGVNDGPVLATASVGIAVSGATDLAREAADVNLPEGALERLPWLIMLARRVRRTIYANIAWALGYNALALTLAATGVLVPIIAAGLMAGSSLVVAVNALRVSRAIEPQVSSSRPGGPVAVQQALGS